MMAVGNNVKNGDTSSEKGLTDNIATVLCQINKYNSYLHPGIVTMAK